MELQIHRKDYRQTRVVQVNRELAPGQALISIDRFALTANNVGYALSGDFIGYWGYYPTDDQEWGNLCVWGVGVVTDAGDTGLDVGERIYGFWPMASEVVVQPGNVREGSFDDVAEHRVNLPPLYNRYQRLQNEPPQFQALENARSVYFPLFMTGYVLYDFLSADDWFGSSQIIIGSVSSKTGYGLASFIKESDYQGEVIGLTSPGNVEFVESLGVCDQVVTYGNEAEIKSIPSTYIDMSGDVGVRSRLHHHLKGMLVNDQMVGGTHWDQTGKNEELPGAKTQFFFAPGHFARRDEEWGKGKLAGLCMQKVGELVVKLADNLDYTFIHGEQGVNEIWQAMLDNKVSGKQGIICSFTRESL